MNVYACSDLHGRYDLYQEIKKFLNPDDKVYCLGDCNDRGPDGWKLIKAIYFDPQFTYLMGNHEHMLMCAMIQLKCDRSLVYGDAIASVFRNGGRETFEAWIEDGKDFGWIQKLQNLKGCVSYINKSDIQIILSHAGYTPRGFQPNLLDLIWDRDHLHNEWPEGYSDVLIVHGHTPVQYINNNGPDKVCWYGQGHKIDIDLATYTSNKAVLLDLDTFDEHYFESSN